MRALLENLGRIEDRVLWALVSMVAAYLAWGAWVAVRERRKTGPEASSAEAAPGTGLDAGLDDGDTTNP